MGSMSCHIVPLVIDGLRVGARTHTQAFVDGGNAGGPGRCWPVAGGVHLV